MQVLKADVRQAILRIAAASFLDKGYDKTSMKEIAREVDVSVGNIYRYYPNKEALFLALIAPASHVLEQLIRHHEEVTEASRGTAGPGLLEQIGGALSHVLLEHREALLILYYRSEGTPLEKEKDRLIVQFTGHVSEHIRGLSGDERAAKPVAVAFLEGLFSIIREYDDAQVIRTVTEHYANIWFQGLKQLL